MDNIVINKIWEDSDFFEVNMVFNSKKLVTNVNIYLTDSIVRQLSSVILAFLNKKNHTSFFEIGEKNDDFPYIRIDFKQVDSHGNVVIEVYIEQFLEEFSDKYHCFFPLNVEFGLLYSFGKKLLDLSDLSVNSRISII